MPAENEAPKDRMQWGRLIRTIATDQDRAAFAALFEYFAPRIKSFLLRSGANEASAEELAQETMLAVWRKAASFDPESSGAAGRTGSFNRASTAASAPFAIVAGGRFVSTAPPTCSIERMKARHCGQDTRCVAIAMCCP